MVSSKSKKSEREICNALQMFDKVKILGDLFPWMILKSELCEINDFLASSRMEKPLSTLSLLMRESINLLISVMFIFDILIILSLLYN